MPAFDGMSPRRPAVYPEVGHEASRRRFWPPVGVLRTAGVQRLLRSPKFITYDRQASNNPTATARSAAVGCAVIVFARHGFESGEIAAPKCRRPLGVCASSLNGSNISCDIGRAYSCTSAIHLTAVRAESSLCTHCRSVYCALGRREGGGRYRSVLRRVRFPPRLARAAVRVFSFKNSMLSSSQDERVPLVRESHKSAACSV